MASEVEARLMELALLAKEAEGYQTGYKAAVDFLLALPPDVLENARVIWVNNQERK